MTIAKPSHGATGWDTATNALLDGYNVLDPDSDGAIDAGRITSGTLATARIASGTASASTFACGDQTWKVITQPPASLLTDAATITTNAALSNVFRVTLGGNRTLGNPTNMVDGQTVTWELIQDATGSRTLTLGSAFALGTTITSTTLTTTANKRDFLTAVYNSTAAKWYVINFQKGY